MGPEMSSNWFWKITDKNTIYEGFFLYGFNSVSWGCQKFVILCQNGVTNQKLDLVRQMLQFFATGDSINKM